MRVFLIAALLVATPAIAQDDNQPQPVADVNRVFKDAEMICPLDKPGKNVILEHALVAGYTVAETVLLYNYCIMYAAGREKELKRR